MEVINRNRKLSDRRIVLTSEEVSRILNAVEAHPLARSEEPSLFDRLNKLWESIVLD